jgi:hypothetical protein
MDFKTALAQLIDAYADAKGSKNNILMTYATQELQRFLEGVEIVPASTTPANMGPSTEVSQE